MMQSYIEARFPEATCGDFVADATTGVVDSCRVHGLSRTLSELRAPDLAYDFSMQSGFLVATKRVPKIKPDYFFVQLIVLFVALAAFIAWNRERYTRLWFAL